MKTTADSESVSRTVLVETHRRSIAKAASWRVFASLVTVAVVYAFSGEWALSAGIGLADTAIKMVAYYSHERLWGRIRFGQTGT